MRYSLRVTGIFFETIVLFRGYSSDNCLLSQPRELVTQLNASLL